MIPVKELPNRDKELYYHNTVIFNKMTGKAELLRHVGEDRAEVMDVRGRAVKLITLEQLEGGYMLHRRTLGWTNAGIGCLYAYSNPGRGNRKAYSMNEVHVISPIYNDIYHVYQLRRSEVAKEDPFFERKLPDDLQKMHDAIRSVSGLKAVSTNYFLHYDSDAFFTVDEARELLNNQRRLGCAINNNWAMIITSDNADKESMLYYQDEPAGTIKLTTGNINFNGNKDLEAAWSRV